MSMAEQFFHTNSSEDFSSVQVIDLSEFLRKYYEDEIQTDVEMTSIRTLLLVDKSIDMLMASSSENYVTSTMRNTEYNLHRLSLAHEKMHSIPQLLLREIASTVKILDISYNKFEKLDFIEEFKELNSLICDHNNITADEYLPYLPKLQLLWMNHCKIIDLYRWIYKLSSSCPNLRFLSLMGNPGAPSFQIHSIERIRYRLFTISLFPFLQHLDDKHVTEDERKKSRKLYQKHLIEILAAKAQQYMPESVRWMSYRVAKITSNSNGLKSEGKNLIV